MPSIVSKIVPVIDLKSNQVVHAIAGDRANYRSISSRLVDSADPGRVAAAFAELGFCTVYVADLDAILGAEPDWHAYHAIAMSGMKLWVDNGVRNIAYANELNRLGHRVIIGLEAVDRADKIDEIATVTGVEQLIVSIDMKSGRLLSNVPEWQEFSPLDVAEFLYRKQVRELILLDLAIVGTASGIISPIVELIRHVRSKLPNTRIYSGGGVKAIADVQTMVDAGCDAVLVSTALHNRAIDL